MYAIDMTGAKIEVRYRGPVGIVTVVPEYVDRAQGLFTIPDIPPEVSYEIVITFPDGASMGFPCPGFMYV